MAQIVRRFGRVLWIVVPLALLAVLLTMPKPAAWGDEGPEQEDPTPEQGQGGGGGEQEAPCLDVEEGAPELPCEDCGPMPMPPPWYGLRIGDSVVEFLGDPPGWFWDEIYRLYPRVLTPPEVSVGAPTMNDPTRPNSIRLIPAVGTRGGSVSLRTGEFHWRIPFPLDPLPAPGPKVAFPLVYRSQAKIDGITGNWDIGFHQHFVEPVPGGNLVFYSGRARSRDVFVRQGSAYLSPLGWTSRLTVVNGLGGSGISFRLMEYDGRFRDFDSQGYLVVLGDTHGNTVILTRNAAIPSQVTAITDSLARTYSLGYTNGRLTSLTDPIGRVQTLGYTPSGFLSSVSTPVTAFVDANGDPANRAITTSFTYTSGFSNPDLNGNLLTVCDDSGHVQVGNQYSAADRVLQQANALGGIFAFDYQSTITAVTRPDGELVEYRFDTNGFVDQIRRVTRTGQNLSPLRDGEPAAYVTGLARDASCGCGRLLSATFPDGTTWTFAYDSAGGLTSRSVSPGTGVPGTTHTWTYARAGWSGFGVVLTATDPAGRVTTFSHDAATGDLTAIAFPRVSLGVPTPYTPTASAVYRSDGQPVSATSVDGVVSTTEYDANLAVPIRTIVGVGLFNVTSSRTLDSAGRAATATDPAGGVASYQYDGLGHLASVTEPSNGITRYLTYDFQGNLVKIEEENRDASGVLDSANPLWTTTRARNAAGQIVAEAMEVSPTESATTTQTYSVGGKTTLLTTPAGRATLRTYDERGFPFRVIRGYGSADETVSQYDYNAAGVPSQRIDGLGHAYSWQRDLLGRSVVETTPAGISTERTFALSGALSTVDLRDASSTLVASFSLLANEAGRQYSRTQWGVTPQGALTANSMTDTVVLRPSGRISSWTDASGQTWSGEFDGLDRVTAFVSPAGDRLEFIYDSASRLVERTFKYKRPDNTFHVVREVYTYDGQSRVRAVDVKDAAGTVLRTSTCAYDGRGAVAQVTDPVGNRTSFVRDGLSRVVSATQEIRSGGVGSGALLSTAVSSAAYDGDGLISSRTDPRNNVTTYSHDALGRLHVVTASDLAQWTFEYDDASRLTRWTDPNGTVVDQAFDADGHVTGRSISRGVGVLGPTTETYAYNAWGACVSAGDGDSTLAWEFDEFGAVKSEFAGQSSLPTLPTTTFTHGSDGRLTGIGYPGGVAATFTNDPDGRPDLASVGGIALSDLDWTGPWPSRLTIGNVREDVTRDTAGRPTSVAWGTIAPTATLRQHAYGWDASSRLLYEARNDLAGIGNVYGYDSLSSLVVSRFGVPNPLAEIANPGSQPFTERRDYALDVTRNRQVVTTTVGGVPTVVNYATNGRNQYTSVGGASRAVTPDGELRTDGTLSYAYDYRSRLVEVRVQTSNALVATYGWDPLDRRDAKIVTGGVSERYFYAGKQLLEVRDVTGVPFTRAQLFYSGAGTAPVAADLKDESDLDSDGNTAETLRVLLLRDHAESLQAVTTDSGSLLEDYRYDDFGRMTAFAPSGVERSSPLARLPDGFQGYVRDAETGLLLVGRRQYSPAIGRFLQADPGGAWHDALGQGSEAQAFEHAPTTFWDRDGLDGVRLSGDIGDLGKGGLEKSTPITSIMQWEATLGYNPLGKGVPAVDGVREEQTDAINKELQRLSGKDSKCYHLIFRDTATQEAFKQAFTKCDIMIVAGHGDVGPKATAPGVTFDKFDGDNNPITVPATSPIESYSQASCGSVFYAESFDAWLKPARDGKGSSVSLMDKALFDPRTRAVGLDKMADFIIKKLQELKDYPCCPIKTVCVLFGKSSNDGAVPKDKWDDYIARIRKRMREAQEASEDK